MIGPCARRLTGLLPHAGRRRFLRWASLLNSGSSSAGLRRRAVGRRAVGRRKRGLGHGRGQRAHARERIPPPMGMHNSQPSNSAWRNSRHQTRGSTHCGRKIFRKKELTEVLSRRGIKVMFRLTSTGSTRGSASSGWQPTPADSSASDRLEWGPWRRSLSASAPRRPGWAPRRRMRPARRRRPPQPGTRLPGRLLLQQLGRLAARRSRPSAARPAGERHARSRPAINEVDRMIRATKSTSSSSSAATTRSSSATSCCRSSPLWGDAMRHEPYTRAARRDATGLAMAEVANQPEQPEVGRATPSSPCT